MKKECIVIKFGTATLTYANGELDLVKIQNLSEQICILAKEFNIIIVSSGAVGTGKVFMKNYSGKINERKAAAAIGNPILINAYSKFFQGNNLQVAQCLFERKHFSNRKEFLQLRETIETIWENGIIPIANENDVVNDLELKFSDNDELATLLAISFNAKKMLIGSSVNGLMNGKKEYVKEVKDINAEVMSWVNPEKSTQGLGGMTSKLTYTKLAVSMGIETIIFNAAQENGVIKANNNETGTTFIPKIKSLKAGLRWIGSGGLAIGKIKIDAGALTALQNRKSLLAVGLTKIKNPFEKGEVIEILNDKNELIAFAKAKVNSNEIDFLQKSMEVAHANEIVML